MVLPAAYYSARLANMSGMQVLEVIGLVFAFFGALLLSIDKLGRTKVCRCIADLSSYLKRRRHAIAGVIGILFASPVLVCSTTQRAQSVILLRGILQLPREYVVLISLMFALLALLLYMLVVEGRARSRGIITGHGNIERGARQLCGFICRWFRFISHPSGLERPVVVHRRSVFRAFYTSFVVVLLLGPIVAFLMSGHILYLAVSLAMSFSFTAGFGLVLLGYVLASGVQRVLGFFVDDEESESSRVGEELKTFRRLSVSGFVGLGLGFLLQILSVVLA